MAEGRNNFRKKQIKNESQKRKKRVFPRKCLELLYVDVEIPYVLPFASM